MTFTEIVQDVADRLNLTSAEALTRIGTAVNTRYKQITASLNLTTSRRGVVLVNTVDATPYVTIPGIEKVLGIQLDGIPLNEVSVEHLRNTLSSDTVSSYAIYRMYANTVQIELNAIPDEVTQLSVDAAVQAGTLVGTMEPEFAESYHDILIFGALSDERAKMEKQALSLKDEATFDRRLKELRMFIAKSAYLDRQRDKRGSSALSSIGSASGSSSGGAGASIASVMVRISLRA